MAAVGQQTIGDVQGRRGFAKQGLAKGELWRGRPVMGQQGPSQVGFDLAFTEHQRQGASSIAQFTTDTQQIPTWAPLLATPAHVQRGQTPSW